MLNPADLPASEAPLIYHERWEQELAFDEIKTHLNGRSVPIRSKTPAGVVQEIYGLMLAHYVVRRVMHDAALVASQDVARLSGLEVEEWYRLLLKEVRRQELRPRRDRWNARVIKQKMSKWNKKRSEHLRPPLPTKTFRDAVVMLI